MTGFLMSVLS